MVTFEIVYVALSPCQFPMLDSDTYIYICPCAFRSTMSSSLLAVGRYLCVIVVSLLTTGPTSLFLPSLFRSTFPAGPGFVVWLGFQVDGKVVGPSKSSIAWAATQRQQRDARTLIITYRS